MPAVVYVIDLNRNAGARRVIRGIKLVLFIPKTMSARKLFV